MKKQARECMEKQSDKLQVSAHILNLKPKHEMRLNYFVAKIPY